MAVGRHVIAAANWTKSALMLACLLAAIPLVCGCSKPPVSEQRNPEPKTSTDLIIEIESALSLGQQSKAVRLCSDAMIRFPRNEQLGLLSARALMESDARIDAVDVITSLNRDLAFESKTLIDQSVVFLISHGELFSAIELLRGSADAFPDRSDHRLQALAFLGELGLDQQARQQFWHVIQQRTFNVAHLVGFTDTNQRKFDTQSMRVMKKLNPADSRLLLGECVQLMDDKKYDEAIRTATQIVSEYPSFTPARALLMRLQSTVGRSITLEMASTTQLRELRQHEDFWLAIGNQATTDSDFRSACYAFSLAAQINPNSTAAWASLAKSLSLADPAPENLPKDLQDTAISKAETLSKLTALLQRFAGSDEQSQSIALRIANCLASQGRLWEAEAWASIALTLPKDTSNQATEIRSEIIADLARADIPDRWQPDYFANASFDLPDRLADYQIKLGDGLSGVNQTEMKHHAATKPLAPSKFGIRFSDESEQRGLEFRGFNPPAIDKGISHSMGAGGATVDYDLDGWPDLAMARYEAVDALTPNLLFRNLAGKLLECHEQAWFNDGGFGQSIAMGDYNGDGFPDLLCANLGVNRLFINQGDGTFTEAKEFSESSDESWTTGALFFDMNSDGTPEIVCINYCDADTEIHQPCREAGGRPVPCHPAAFPPDHDTITTSRNVAINDTSAEPTELTESPGRALGIIGGNFSGGGASVFIANDMTANHLYSGTQYIENAIVAGLALDDQSSAQASMGIASSDFDRDGDLDFFVTGFVNETNIFYQQVKPGIWLDANYSALIDRISLDRVGFGCQAIDFENDGLDDIAITNGHIAEFSVANQPLAQPFEMIRNSRPHGFAPLAIESWGSYFSTGHVGRALWCVDIDQDRLMDLVVTHQDDQPKLLRNASESNYKAVRLTLVGTKSERTGAGSIVEVSSDDNRRTYWLNSGSGYMASNEHCIIIAGLQDTQSIAIDVHWASGETESFGNMTASSDFLAVQGHGKPFRLR